MNLIPVATVALFSGALSVHLCVLRMQDHMVKASLVVLAEMAKEDEEAAPKAVDGSSKDAKAGAAIAMN